MTSAPSPQDIGVVREVYEQVLGAGRLDLIDSLVSESYLDHNPAPGTTADREGFRKAAQMWRMGFPDLNVAIDQLLADAGKVAVRLTMRGTHSGPFAGIAPSNQPISQSGMAFLTVRDGKLAERWGSNDIGGLMAALNTPAQQQDAVEKNKDLIVRYFEAIWNKGEFEREPEFVAKDVVVHQSPIPGLPDGIAGPLQIVGSFRAAIPDIRVEHTLVFGEGDKVVHRWEARGHHTAAPLFGAAITDKEIIMTGINSFRIADGRIAERWGHMDIMGLLQQIGLAPSH